MDNATAMAVAAKWASPAIHNSDSDLTLTRGSSIGSGRLRAYFSTLLNEIKVMIWANLEEERLIIFTSSK